MTRSELTREIKNKRSFLCIGLDPDLERIPDYLHDHDDPLFEFNRTIIDATRDYCVAYKPNLAFYESFGAEGWRSFEKTIDYIPSTHFIIADAKRGDIGNTSRNYARAFFENLPCDAVTVAPYMGADSVQPFLEYNNKWAVLLALTSNMGSDDFQRLEAKGEPLYSHVIRKAVSWGREDNLMLVVGATHPTDFQHIRKIAPGHFLLVPGVGAQGGDLRSVFEQGHTSDCGLLVNSSRSIIYAGSRKDFGEKAKEAASTLQQEMAALLEEFEL